MIPLVKVNLPSEDLLMPALRDVMYGGIIGEGEFVYEFERQFSSVFGVNEVVAMSSGTAALHTALILAGVKPGDEVITTSMTAEPTNVVLLQMGVVPVFADVNEDSGNICPDDILTKISKKTKAVLVVHYAGVPVQLSSITKICMKNEIKLIEDCAHALGATYSGQPIGSFGDFSIFSFQAIKHMTTIDGGVLVVKDSKLVPEAKKIRWFGLEKGVARTEVDINSIGYKYNMHNVAAVIGLEQLKDIQDKISVHIENGQYFDEVFSGMDGFSGATFDQGARPSYWIYTLITEHADDVVRLLAEIDVSASKLHRPNHLHSIFSPYSTELKNLDRFYERFIHIPCGWWITESLRENIVKTIKKG